MSDPKIPKAKDGRIDKYSDESDKEYNPVLTGISKEKLDKLTEMLESFDENPTDEQIN